MSHVKGIDSIHLLLVEDNIGYSQELTEWLKIFGYRHISLARSVAETKEKLLQPFDVIIADMRMDQNDSGFIVIDEVKQRDLCSVVIILTANDTVTDCRKAFKMGAWDYISKNMRGNVFEVLHQSIQDAAAYFNRWGNTQNEQWIVENMASLRERHLGQYIAVINKTVIESSHTLEDLERRIEERQLRRFLTTIKRIGDRRPIIDLIGQPESSTLEFKGSLQWDIKENRKNKDLQFGILKTITAFLNSGGGTLLIGVNDDRTIFGLERDLSLFSQATVDSFEQTLINLISQRIGANFCAFIQIYFELIDEKQVCALEVRTSNLPAFLTWRQEPEFYIRAGNTSRPLNMQETINYLSATPAAPGL